MGGLIRLPATATMRGMVAVAQTHLTELRRGVLEFCVLAALRDRECYGFELSKLLANSGGLLASEGTIYPLLARLRRDGSVKTRWRESEVGPRRRYYALTEDGRVALEQFMVAWVHFRDAVDALLQQAED
jgi:PadR family transcriptional regulator PadR